MDPHFFTGLRKLKLDAYQYRRDDDFADRISHRLTTLLLLIFTVVVSARQYIGKPIACWVPAEFTSSQEEYAESFCWVSNTYFVTSNRPIPHSTPDRENSKLTYYQWVPFMLMVQAVMFNIPYMIWRLFHWQTGIHLTTIIEVAGDVDLMKDQETRQSSLSYVCRYIDQSLKSQRISDKTSGNQCRNCLSKATCLWFGKRHGNYLTSLYLTTKLLYITNVIGQFFLMNIFLGSKYTYYGLDLVRSLSQGYSSELTGNFPRVTFCDFEVRKLANLHKHTIQCVLPINMFNEKIFIFLWFWFVFVASVSITSLFYWMSRLGFKSSRTNFIRKFLKLRNLIGHSDMKLSIDFTLNYLRQDGILIIRLLSQNIGELVASEIVEKIWKQYKSQIQIDAADPKRRRSMIYNINNQTADAAYSLLRKRESIPIQNTHTSSTSSQSTEKSQQSKKLRRKKNKIGGEQNNFSLDHLEEDPGEFV